MRKSAKWRVAIMLVAPLIGAVTTAVPANAETVTGAAEKAVEAGATPSWCNEGNWPTGFPCWLDGVLNDKYRRGVAVGTTALSQADWAADYAVNGDKTDPPVGVVNSLLGQAVNQTETLLELMGLYVSVSVVSGTAGAYVNYYGPGGPITRGVGVSQPDLYTPTTNPTGWLDGYTHCPTCIAAAPGNYPQGSSDDGVSNFYWVNNVALYHRPNDSSGGPNALDGRINYNFYRSNNKPNPAWDFFASSHAYSVTPINGRKLKELNAHILPKGELEPVDADPLAVNKFGSAGSWNLGANLQGEAKMGNYGGGAGFNIGKTWNYPEGYGGGGQLSSGEHYTHWKTGSGSGSGTAKSTAGVETWKRPTDGSGYYQIGAVATWK